MRQTPYRKLTAVYEGVEYNVSQLSRKFGIDYDTMYKRVASNHTGKQLSAPKRSKSEAGTMGASKSPWRKFRAPPK